ncbi:DUF6112 family protein [Kitasatospora sp. NPDC001574]
MSSLILAAEAVSHLAIDPGVAPADGGLPGLTVLKQVVSSINLFAVIATVGAMSVAGVVWAWGHHSGSHGAEQKGKQGAMVAGGVALLLGAANGLVAFFSALGTQVK